MAYPADAKQMKLTRQFPDEDIWKLIEEGRIRTAGDWLREEIANKEWDYDAAEAALNTDRAHLWRVIHGQNRLSEYKVMIFAAIFGHVKDEHGNYTAHKIEYLVALFAYDADFRKRRATAGLSPR